MKPIDQGVLKDSALYFHTASTQAVKTYFYLLCTGKYYCSDDYIVHRNSYDSFLLMYIRKGRGCITINQKASIFNEGQAVLLDCYRPHTYYAMGEMETIWFHFDGIAARNYYELITNNSGNIINLKEPYSFEKDMLKIYSPFQDGLPANEALLAKHITNVLTSLIISNHVQTDYDGNSDTIDEVLSYIRDNINENLSLNDLASRASLSLYYFSRVFKRETGFTPHEYIIAARVNAAKFYLKASSSPIKEICFSCGFSCESSFCTTFKKQTGMTPSDFRNNTILTVLE